MSYVRMVIGEANSEKQAKEFTAIARECFEALEPEQRLVSYSVLVEDDGRMVVTLTEWSTREDCVRYHCSRVYRQLVARTQHLFVGEFVVRLFAKAESDVLRDQTGVRI